MFFCNDNPSHCTLYQRLPTYVYTEIKAYSHGSSAYRIGHDCERVGAGHSVRKLRNSCKNLTTFSFRPVFVYFLAICISEDGIHLSLTYHVLKVNIHICFLLFVFSFECVDTLVTLTWAYSKKEWRSVFVILKWTNVHMSGGESRWSKWKESAFTQFQWKLLSVLFYVSLCMK